MHHARAFGLVFSWVWHNHFQSENWFSWNCVCPGNDANHFPVKKNSNILNKIKNLYGLAIINFRVKIVFSIKLYNFSYFFFFIVTKAPFTNAHNIVLCREKSQLRVFRAPTEIKLYFRNMFNINRRPHNIIKYLQFHDNKPNGFRVRIIVHKNNTIIIFFKGVTTFLILAYVKIISKIQVSKQFS